MSNTAHLGVFCHVISSWLQPLFHEAIHSGRDVLRQLFCSGLQLLARELLRVGLDVFGNVLCEGFEGLGVELLRGRLQAQGNLLGRPDNHIPEEKQVID